jgi:polyisoprenoid-binding protein YceI
MINNKLSKASFGKLARYFYPLGLCFMATTSASNAYSACSYSVNSQWNGGFNATIKITNNGSSAINTWSVNWQYAGQDRVANAYNTNLTGSNPYTATNFGWNGTIQPNQTVEFGLNGSKGSAAAEVPLLTGSVCGGVASSTQAKSSVTNISSSKMASSTAASVVASSASSVAVSHPSSSSIKSFSSVALSSAGSSISSSVNASKANSNGNWSLDSSTSYLSFATTKNINTVESHTFTGIAGDISDAGLATLVIDLNSVNTGNAIRDGRMQGLLFEVVKFPSATVTLNLTTNQIGDIPIGGAATQNISANLNLHGVDGIINTKVSVQKLSATRIQVQSLSPVIINAPDYALANGVEELRKAVNITSISTAVPVNFILFYDINK